MEIDLETDINVLYRMESEENRIRLNEVLTVVNSSVPTQMDWFKLALHTSIFPKNAKQLALDGKFREAFYLFSDTCKHQCLRYNPLIVALKTNDELLLKYLLRLDHYYLRVCCDCHDFRKCRQLIDKLSQKTLRKLKEMYPKLSTLVDAVFEYRMASVDGGRENSAALESATNKYYKTGSDPDMSNVLDILYNINEPLDARQVSLLWKEEYGISQTPSFVKLLKNMKRIHIESMIEAKTFNLFRSKCLFGYMAQPRRNLMLFHILFHHYNRINDAILYEALSFGGDIYASDCQGNPWIVCLLARSCWTKFDENSIKESEESRLLSICGESFITHPCINFYLHAKSRDRWRMESHHMRSERFREITRTLLLCVVRTKGRSLPKPVIIRLMEYVTWNDRTDNAKVVEKEHFAMAYRLILSTLYLETYGANIFRLASSKGVWCNKGNKDFPRSTMSSLAAELGDKIFHHCISRGINISGFLGEIELKSNAIANTLRPHQLIDKELELRNLQRIPFGTDRLDVSVVSSMRLAFHHTTFLMEFGENSKPDVMAMESATKKLKVVPFKRGIDGDGMYELLSNDPTTQT